MFGLLIFLVSIIEDVFMTSLTGSVFMRTSAALDDEKTFVFNTGGSIASWLCW